MLQNQCAEISLNVVSQLQTIGILTFILQVIILCNMEITTMKNQFLESIALRRSIYNLGNTLPVSKDEVTKTIQEAIRTSPSPFNSQSARAVILYGDESKKVWKFVLDALLMIVPADQIEDTKNKIASFDSGVGTVLVFEEMAVVKNLQDAMPLYKENFALWSHHGTGLTQFSIWSALANIKVGASLQHYGNLIEDAVKKAWDLPSSWSLIAQMPFGSIKSPAEEKTFQPIEERVLVKG